MSCIPSHMCLHSVASPACIACSLSSLPQHQHVQSSYHPRCRPSEAYGPAGLWRAGSWWVQGGEGIAVVQANPGCSRSSCSCANAVSSNSRQAWQEGGAAQTPPIDVNNKGHRPQGQDVMRPRRLDDQHDQCCSQERRRLIGEDQQGALRWEAQASCSIDPARETKTTVCFTSGRT